MPHTRCNILEFREVLLNAKILLTRTMYMLRTRQRILYVLEVVFPDGCIHGNKNRDVHTLWKQTRPGAARNEIFADLFVAL